MTEETDRALFESQCKMWIEKFGLTDWDFRCVLNDDLINRLMPILLEVKQ